MLLCPKCERGFRKAETLAKHAYVCAITSCPWCGKRLETMRLTRGEATS